MSVEPRCLHLMQRVTAVLVELDALLDEDTEELEHSPKVRRKIIEARDAARTASAGLGRAAVMLRAEQMNPHA